MFKDKYFYTAWFVLLILINTKGQSSQPIAFKGSSDGPSDGRITSFDLSKNGQVWHFRHRSGKKIRTFVETNEASFGVITFKENQAIGLIQSHSGRWFKIYTSGPEWYAEPLKINRALGCGNETLQQNSQNLVEYQNVSSSQVIGFNKSSPRNTFKNSISAIEISLDINVSSELLNKFDNDKSKTEEEIQSRFTIVEKIFEEQVNLKIKLNSINFLNEGEVNSKDKFNSFLDYSRANPTDAHLNHALYVASGGLAGQGTVGGICNSVSWSSISDDHIFDALVFAHELGHLMGARHTHNCIWPGGAIDSCASEDILCLDQVYLEDNRAGTIMSYCKDDVPEFHPYVIELMRGFIGYALCGDFSDPSIENMGKIRSKNSVT